MSLFQCDKCGCVENTACCNWAWRVGNDKSALCSACDPDIGKWHGVFTRKFLPKGMFKTARNGNLEHKDTKEQDYSTYVIEEPNHEPD